MRRAGDETLLRRMIFNLLHNAIAYTPDGGTVSVTGGPAGSGVHLKLSDTGPGIPPDSLERVFERFVRLDPARGSGGSGLGLAIARWIAEVHGGTLGIESSGPGGTTFIAPASRLPARRAPFTRRIATTISTGPGPTCAAAPRSATCR